jgi:branched-chain amino acid aminotransferase
VHDVQRPVAAAGGALQGRSFSSSVLPIKVNSMSITRAATPKPKPTFDISLPFGTKFSDHMLEIDWDIKTGFGAPRIVPYHALAIDPSSPCLHYGVQCFEGMKAYKDEKGRVRLFRPDMNMKRFKTSCQRLSLPTFDESQMLECLKKLIQEDKDWVPQETGYSLYIRPTAIATSETLGVSPPHHALFYVITCPVGPYFKAGFAPVKILAEDSFRRAWPGGVGNYKVGGNYAPGLLPQKLAADKGYSQILWLFGEEQYITEVGSMNLFVFWKNSAGKQELITAPLDGTILPGVTRDSILRLARSWGEFEVSERPYTMKELADAIAQGRLLEAFGAGTAATVAPIDVIAYKGSELKVPCGTDGKAGDVAKRLYKDLADIQYGRKAFEDWSVVIT